MASYLKNEADLAEYINLRFDIPRYRVKACKYMPCARILEHKLTKSKVLVYLDFNNKIHEKLLS